MSSFLPIFIRFRHSSILFQYCSHTPFKAFAITGNWLSFGISSSLHNISIMTLTVSNLSLFLIIVSISGTISASSPILVVCVLFKSLSSTWVFSWSCFRSLFIEECPSFGLNLICIGFFASKLFDSFFFICFYVVFYDWYLIVSFLFCE